MSIKELNDQLRKTGDLTLGRVMVTVGVSTMSDEDQIELFNKVKEFNTFNEDNDPYDEHDFGMLMYGGIKYMWKIDYYDNNYEHLSPDPSDVDVTRRVMTIMQASEY